MNMKINKKNIQYLLTSVLVFIVTWLLFLWIKKSVLNLVGFSIVHIAVWLFAHSAFISKKMPYRQFLGLEVLFLLFFYAIYFTAKIDVLIMPIIAFSLITTVLYSPLVSTSMSTALILYAVIFGHIGIYQIVGYLVASTCSSVIGSITRQRVRLVVVGVVSGVILYLVVISANYTKLELRQLYALLNGALSSMLAIGIMPIMESVFGMITPMRLMELSNPSKPLLKRLMLEAPGTYHHSMMVGHMSEAAAGEIGANRLLARVGAYYHDIGKLNAPYNYIENQGGGENPHDNLTPEESVECLRKHVSYGVELLKKNHYPKPIIEIARRHHGDSMMRYFYHKKMTSSQEGDVELDVADFSHVGPKPETKEQCIIMFADCVEAAVRAMNGKPVDEVVDLIFDQKIREDQMSNSELTFKELHVIKRAFIDVLNASGHQRVEYPEIKNLKKDTQEDNVEIQE